MDLTRRDLLTSMGVTVCSLVLAGCTGDDTTAAKKVKVLDHEMVSDDEGLAVQGTAKNVSGEEISYAEIGVEWLEGEAFLTSSFDFFTDWPAGEIQEFDIGYRRNWRDKGSAEVITNYRIRVKRVSTDE